MAAMIDEIYVVWCGQNYRVTYAYYGEINPLVEGEVMSHTAGMNRGRNYWRKLKATPAGRYRTVVIKARQLILGRAEA